MKYLRTLCLLTSLVLCTGCVSDTVHSQESLPTENELPQVPNCAADGPGCQQFNPALKG